MPAKIMNYPLSDQGRANWDGIFTPDVRYEVAARSIPIEYLGVPETNDDTEQGEQ